MSLNRWVSALRLWETLRKNNFVIRCWNSQSPLQRNNGLCILQLYAAQTLAENLAGKHNKELYGRRNA